MTAKPSLHFKLVGLVMLQIMIAILQARRLESFGICEYV